MADSVVEKNETTVATPEKEVEKPAPEVTDEDSKTSENGDAKVKANGDKAADDEEAKETENGDSTDAPTSEDACPIKRKSAAGDAPDGTPAEGASPEKKAKLEEKVAEAESNGEEAKVAA